MNTASLIDGRYRLGPELGAGAFGCVYKATQVVLGRDMREIALKIFKADSIDASNVAEKMNDALAIIALVSDLTDWEIRQHFVTVFDLGLSQENPSRAFVAMELVSEGSLAKRLRNNPHFTLHGTLHYLVQIVRALAFMHSRRFVHSDLKPDNILLFRHCGRDLIKIGDFGLAGKYQGPIGDGPCGGDLAYMAPEVISGTNTLPASDVFSVGVMAFEMLTGRNPYVHVGETLSQEQREDATLMRELRLNSRTEPLQLRPHDFPELSAGTEGARLMPLVQIINRMLDPDLQRRYRSAIEVKNDIEHQLADLISVPRTDREASGHATSETVFAPDEQSLKLRRAAKVQEHVVRWQSAIDLKNWDSAEKIAAEVVSFSPQSAEGYLLKAKIKRYQADALGASERHRETAKGMLNKAARILRESLPLVAQAEQHEIRQELVNIGRLIGDEQVTSIYQDSR